MNILLYLIVISLSFGNFLRLSFFNQQVNFYFHEIFIILFILFSIKNYKSIFNFIKKNKSIYLYILILSISLFNNFWSYNFFQNTVGFMYLARLTLYFLFYSSLSVYVLSLKDKQVLFKKILHLFFLLTGIFSFIQFLFYPDLRNLEYLGWDPHQYRLFGMFLDTTIAGMVFILGFYFYLLDKKKNVFNLFFNFIYFIFILFTYSRITYIAFFISLIFYFIESKKIKYLLIFLFIFIIGIFILPKPKGESVNLARTFTIDARISDFKNGIEIWKKNMVFGVGYNRIRYVKNSSSLHSGASFSSSFLTILVASGIFGLGFFIYFLYKQFIYLTFEGKLYVLPIIIASVFDNVLLNGLILGLFFVISSFTLSGKKQ